MEENGRLLYSKKQTYASHNNRNKRRNSKTNYSVHLTRLSSNDTNSKIYIIITNNKSNLIAFMQMKRTEKINRKNAIECVCYLKRSQTIGVK